MTDMKETSLAAITRGTDANYGVQAGGEKVSENLGSVAKAQCVVEEDQLKFAAVAEQNNLGATTTISGAGHDNEDPFVSDEELRSKGITVRTVAESSGTTVSNAQSDAVSKPVAEHKGITIAPASDMTSMIEEAIRGKSVEPENKADNEAVSEDIDIFATDATPKFPGYSEDEALDIFNAFFPDDKGQDLFDDFSLSEDKSISDAPAESEKKKEKAVKKDKLSQIEQLVDSETYEKIKGILDSNTDVRILGIDGGHRTRITLENSEMFSVAAKRFKGINKSTLLGLIIYNAVNDRVEDGDTFLRIPVSLIVDDTAQQADKRVAYEVSPLMYSNLNNSKYCCGLPLDSLINAWLRAFLIGLPECKFDLNYIFDYHRYTQPSEDYEALEYEQRTSMAILIPEQIKSTFRFRVEHSGVVINVSVRKNIGMNNQGYCLSLEDMPVFSFNDSSMLSSISVYSHVSGDINYLAIHLDSSSKQRVLYGLIHDKNLYIWNPSRGWQGARLLEI